jgi:transposase-like protein
MLSVDQFEPTELPVSNWLTPAGREDGTSAADSSAVEWKELDRLCERIRQMKQERDLLATAKAWLARKTGRMQPASSSVRASASPKAE